MNSNYEALLSLTRLGIGHKSTLPSNSIDWQSIQDIAVNQGLSAVVLDGLEVLRSNDRHNLPDKLFLTQWIGEVLQGFEYRFDLYRRTIAEMASFYNSHGFKMMLLKGYACSMDWPRPDHRPVGDIDIWQFGEYKKADALLVSEKGVEVDNSHHHHTMFYWGDFMVENHYDFVNVHAHRSNVKLEKVFKELGSETNLDENDNYNSVGMRIPSVEVYGEKVYLPSPNLHALFLIKHAAIHFVGANINLRQVLDWAFFVKAHTNEIDWRWLNTVIEEYHMNEFYNCINAICVEELGFSASIFHGVQFNPIIKDKVLKDILNPKFSVGKPARLIPRLVYKYRRWKGNSWKHKMCYKESMWSAFWSGVWNHLLKPASI